MKIPTFWYDLDVARMARGGGPPASGAIALVQGRRHDFLAKVAQHVAVVLHPPRNDVDDVAVRIALHDPMHRHQPRAHDDLALLFEYVGPDDEVGDAGLILECDEDHALGTPGPLADEDEARQRHAL